jgi:3-hydroxy-5-methyl-1-naphthoate 3-O-methyltransferase
MIPSAKHIMDMANAFYDSCVLFAANDLGIFTAIAELEPADSSAIAEKCRIDPRGARLLLDACAALNLVTKTEEKYSNAPETKFYLVEGAPGDLGKAIRYNRDVYAAWGKLKEFARTGKPVEKPEIHLGTDKERTRNFVLAMHSRALGIGKIAIPSIDLSGCRKILDVGGGPGTFSMLFADKYPELTSTVLDLPEVAEIAAELIAQHGKSDRVKPLGGSYHEVDFPKEVDAVLFFGMLHQESPEGIRSLLKKAYAALKKGGKVWVMDMMTDKSRTQPAFSALFAVNMALTTNNGWVFSDHDLTGWLSEAGFSDIAVQPLPQPMMHWVCHAEKK